MSLGGRMANGRGRVRRLGTVAGLVLAMLVGTTGVASANVDVNCADYDWSQSTDGMTIVQYELLSVTPVFNVADTRYAQNNLDDPISVTFTSQQSRTYSISVTGSMGASLFGFLTANVSSSIQQSRTTALGVSVTATVPAHSARKGEYGVQAYDVVYRYTTIVHRAFSQTCFRTDPVVNQVNAPTNLEGWRISPA